MSRGKPPPNPPPSPPPPPDLVIDGSLGEGGGQIVRLSLSLSAVFSRSVLITNVRRARPTPGLQAQHVAAAHLVAALANAPLTDARPGSLRLSQGHPAQRQQHLPLPVQAAAATAGATSLILQAGLPVALRFVPGDPDNTALLLKGGTTALFAPSSHYVAKVLVPNLRLFGIDLKYSVDKHGFFPRGGGAVSVAIDKTACAPVDGSDTLCTLNPVDLSEQGSILALQGELLVCGHEYVAAGVVGAMLNAATAKVRCSAPGGEPFAPFTRKHINVTDVSRENSSGKCLCLTLFARTSKGTVLGATALWSEKEAEKHPEWGSLAKKQGRTTYKDKVKFWRATAAAAASEAILELLTTIRLGAAVDAHMADQLMVFMAMAKGTSRIKVPKVTTHLLSVFGVFSRFDVDVRFDENADADRYIVVCEGKGVELVR